MASYSVNESGQREISLGRSVDFDPTQLHRDSSLREDVIAAIGPAGDLIALLKVIDQRLQPVVVLPESRLEAEM
jgi:hypothetical protein